MSNVIPGSKSNHKMIQEALTNIHNNNGFNVLYEEKDLHIKLPEITVHETQDFLSTLNDWQEIEKDIEKKYDIKEGHVHDGKMTLSPQLKLKIALK